MKYRGPRPEATRHGHDEHMQTLNDAKTAVKSRVSSLDGGSWCKTHVQARGEEHWRRVGIIRLQHARYFRTSQVHTFVLRVCPVRFGFQAGVGVRRLKHC